MNIEYLKKIKEVTTHNVEGFMVKDVEFVNGTLDERDRQFLRPHSAIKVAFPVDFNNYSYDDYCNDFNTTLVAIGHKSSKNIIHILSILFIRMRNKSFSTELAWRQFWSKMFTTCDLHLEYPTKIEVPDFIEPLRLYNYMIGKFDFSTLKSKISLNTQSDFWNRYIQYNFDNEIIIADFLSFRRLEDDIKIINIIEFVVKKIYK